MARIFHLVFSSCALVATTLAFGQTPSVMRDLDAFRPVTLSKEELTKLLPDANMSRLNAKGDAQRWKNDSSGKFIISSDNRAIGGGNSSTQGKWNISDDGRYCVLIEWRSVPAEEWCRYIVKAGDAYYGTKSDKSGTERVYRLEISK
jgi:hypothetical protein